jgi:hypothetical protein
MLYLALPHCEITLKGDCTFRGSGLDCCPFWKAFSPSDRPLEMRAREYMESVIADQKKVGTYKKLRDWHFSSGNLFDENKDGVGEAQRVLSGADGSVFPSSLIGKGELIRVTVWLMRQDPETWPRNISQYDEEFHRSFIKVYKLLSKRASLSVRQPTKMELEGAKVWNGTGMGATSFLDIEKGATKEVFFQSLTEKVGFAEGAQNMGPPERSASVITACTVSDQVSSAEN